MACLWRSEATQLSKRNSCTSISWAEQSTPSPLPELGLLCQIVFEAKERGTGSCRQKELEHLPKQKLLALACITAVTTSGCWGPVSLPQSSAPRSSPDSQQVGSWPLCKCQSPMFSELFFLVCLWVKLSCVFSRKAKVSF